MDQERDLRISNRLPAILLTMTLVVPLALAGAASPASTELREEPTPLERLAATFGESASSSSVDSEDAHCGTQGHCNFVTCPDPGCGIDEDPVYECTATEYRCSDDHTWDPFDNDEHAVYNCASTCKPEVSGPEDCVVNNPLGSGCLVPDVSCGPDLGVVTMKVETWGGVPGGGGPGC